MYNRDRAVSTRPEAELLLCCARTCMDSERAERIRTLLRADIDWAYLLQTALRHGVMPLLYWSLNNTCPEAVPRAILDQLRDDFHNNARRNLFLTGELLKLLKLFEAHEISAIPFKGPVLAFSVYGNLALRQFSDLDVLVHKQDIPKAQELLVSLGYRPLVQPTGAQKLALKRDGHLAFVFVGDNGRSFVELHWEIIRRYFSFPLDPERLWERLEPICLGGKEVLTLSPEDLLLILCVHGARHLWERLEWICDVAKLIGVHKGMHWGRVMKQASTLGSERMLFLGFFLASDLLGAALPEGVWQRVRSDRVVKSLAAQVRERLFLETNSPSGIFESDLFYLRARERPGDRLQYCLRRAMTPTIEDWEFLPLPAFLSFLYYLLRPIRLVGKYGLSPLQRLLKHLLIR